MGYPYMTPGMPPAAGYAVQSPYYGYPQANMYAAAGVYGQQSGSLAAEAARVARAATAATAAAANGPTTLSRPRPPRRRAVATATTPRSSITTETTVNPRTGGDRVGRRRFFCSTGSGVTYCRRVESSGSSKSVWKMTRFQPPRRENDEYAFAAPPNHAHLIATFPPSHPPNLVQQLLVGIFSRGHRGEMKVTKTSGCSVRSP